MGRIMTAPPVPRPSYQNTFADGHEHDYQPDRYGVTCSRCGAWSSALACVPMDDAS